MWLSRSLEEIDLWRGRVGGLERTVKEQREALARQQEEATALGVAVDGERTEEEQKKLVRFKEDCPPSPVVSEDGDYEGGAAAANAPPPGSLPPLPTVWSSPSKEGGRSNSYGAAKNDGPSATAAADSPIVANSGMDGIQTGVFSPDTLSSAGSADGPEHAVETPSKADLVASGRAVLHRASPASARRAKDGLPPHPRLQAAELLKRSAATRRLLRERLTPGSTGGVPQRSPAAAAFVPRTSSDPALHRDEGGGASFAGRQGAACKAIGRAIRESGARLRLDAPLMLANGSPPAELVIEGVAQLESMVKEYCGSVEGTIGRQREKIEELLAFCDHLETEVMLDRE